MLEDTVLIGGIAFLALAGLAWLAMEKITNSGLSERAKRLLIYVLIAVLGGGLPCLFSAGIARIGEIKL
ncbi:hypothetical protein OAT45_05220 [Alphaproteobacteria bacterium]|nr:hypothetical protein [Alphaproteobacteria bacterium]